MGLEAHLLEGVEVVCFLEDLTEEEAEATVPQVTAHDCRPLSDSAWLSLASASADSEDAVCTKVAAVPGQIKMTQACQTECIKYL